MVAQIDGPYFRASPRKALVRLLSFAMFEGRPLTARARWLNPLVFSVARAATRMRQLKTVKKPIFILGSGRSGTTILGLILSMHRSIGFLNEPKALWHAAYPYADINGNFCRDSARYRLSADDVDDDVRRTMHHTYGSYLWLTRTSRVLDKYPELIFRIPFVLEIFPDARFLFLVRNGIDTCHSIAGWSERHSDRFSRSHINWWGIDNRKWHIMVDQLVRKDPRLKSRAESIAALTRQCDMAAVEWSLTMREGLEAMKRYPELVFRVRYEEMTNSPESTLKAILEFCNLEYYENVVRYATGVLHPAARRPVLEITESIRDVFNELMNELDYATA